MKKILFFILVLFLIFVSYFFIAKSESTQDIVWGVNFSQKHSANLGLDWKENYLALLEDLKVKKIKLSAHWDLLEPEKDKFYFDDLDWQIIEAQKKETKILLVLGMKTGRWPECHIPDWAKNFDKEKQQTEILEMVKALVLRYRDFENIEYWQVENEPFFPFGKCPWTDIDFLKKEISLVKSLDQKQRKIIVSDSGEGSLWIRAARLGDIAGTTMYKKVWFSFSWEKEKMSFLPDSLKKFGFYINYPFPPKFYWLKAQLIKKLFQKRVICVELQAEPWGPALLYDSPLAEQEKTMNLEQFKYNIDFAQKTGLEEFYFWGAEWWYWMKEKQGRPEIWQEAKNLLN